MLLYPYAFLCLFGFELFLQGAELRIQFRGKGLCCSSSSLTQIIQRGFTNLIHFHPKIKHLLFLLLIYMASIDLADSEC